MTTSSTSKPILPVDAQGIEAMTELPADVLKYDPLSLDNLRLSQDFLQTGGSKKLLTRIPLMKPDGQVYIRVHPTHRGEFAIVELKSENEMYLVSSKMIPELMGEFFVATIYIAITRQGVLFAWPIRLPGADGRDNPYWQTAREGAALAMEKWIRVKSNQSLRAYEYFEPPTGIKIPDPTWPDLSFEQEMRLVGKDIVIEGSDHIAVQRLRGAV